MWKTQLLLLVTSVTSCWCLQEVSVTSTFRRLGSLATGLNYAHIHGNIDFRGLQLAQHQVVEALEERMKQSATREEKTLLDAIRPQLDIATKTLEDLQVLFFGQQTHRPKRQLFLGIAMALGLVGAGSSIYTATEVSKLHVEIASVRSDFQHVAHMLESEAQVVNKLAADVHSVSKVCQVTLGRLLEEENKLNMLTGVMGLMSVVNNFNAELSAWGRGLESLANGKLHPSLTDHRKLRHAVSVINGKAKAVGRRILHDNDNAIFTAPVSYLATSDGNIIFIAHIPLVEQEPLELFEYLSTPVKHADFYLEVTAQNRILAMDSRGQTGLEMSHEDLLRCQSEEQHNGQMFICSNTNLVRNNIRSTCLGAIFFNQQREVEECCEHLMMRNISEQVRQISKTEIMVFTNTETTVTEKCRNGTRYHQIMGGLVKMTTVPGCELSTKEFTFRSLEDIDLSENNMERKVTTTKFAFLKQRTDKEIQEALRSLKEMKEPEHIKVDQLEAWMKERDQETWSDNMSSAKAGVAGAVGFSAIVVILCLYIKYQRSKCAKN